MSGPERCWMSDPPTRCDLCRKPIASYFVDGATRYGPWAIMCADCCAEHMPHDGGFGTGKGQAYRRKGEKWIKVAG
jgi:hypothetical protein